MNISNWWRVIKRTSADNDVNHSNLFISIFFHNSFSFLSFEDVNEVVRVWQMKIKVTDTAIGLNHEHCFNPIVTIPRTACLIGNRETKIDNWSKWKWIIHFCTLFRPRVQFHLSCKRLWINHLRIIHWTIYFFFILYIFYLFIYACVWVLYNFLY